MYGYVSQSLLWRVSQSIPWLILTLPHAFTHSRFRMPSPNEQVLWHNFGKKVWWGILCYVLMVGVGLHKIHNQPGAPCRLNPSLVVDRKVYYMVGGTGVFAGKQRFSFRVYTRMFLPGTICKLSIISSRQSGTDCLHDKNCPAFAVIPVERTGIPLCRDGKWILLHVQLNC